MNNTVYFIISLVAVALSFILWYSFAYREYILVEEELQSEIQYIDISTSTRNITIKNAPENIRFRVDKSIIHTGSINLK